eukprot:m.197968 g.197968  ORF g.197968 m.197968 type:complete len:1636 (-) comp17033_c0_seq4:73-4980(-)
MSAMNTDTETTLSTMSNNIQLPGKQALESGRNTELSGMDSGEETETVEPMPVKKKSGIKRRTSQRRSQQRRQEQADSDTEAEDDELTGKRLHIVNEMVKTEEDYVRDLDSIIQGYLLKFKDTLSTEDVEVIFGNIQDLHQLHCDFLDKLQMYTTTKPLLLGQVFMEMGGRFMLYEPYYSNHPAAMALLQELSRGQDFQAMKLGCQMLIGHQLPLADYLLKPVQRLLKYPLLLSEMLKATPDGSKGHAELHRALTIMKEVAARINEIKARNEMADYVQDLSDRIHGWDGLPLTRLGRLLDVATMKMTDDHSSKRTERYIMLFENALVICKWKSAEQVAIKRMCLMDKFFLNTMVEDPLSFRMTLADSSRHNLLTFCCDTEKDKRYWVAKIKKVIVEFYTNGKNSDNLLRDWQAEKKSNNKSGSTPTSPRKATAGGGKNKRNKAIQRLKMVPHRRESEVLANQLPELDFKDVHSTVDNKASMHVVEVKDRKRRNSKSDIEYESSKDDPPSPAPTSHNRAKSPAPGATSPMAMSPSMMRAGKWMVRLTFPGGTHTKVVAQAGQTVAQVFGRALAKRGLEADMHVLRRDDSPKDVLYWEADIADAANCVAVTVMPVMQTLDHDLDESCTDDLGTPASPTSMVSSLLARARQASQVALRRTSRLSTGSRFSEASEDAGPYRPILQSVSDGSDLEEYRRSVAADPTIQNSPLMPVVAEEETTTEQDLKPSSTGMTLIEASDSCPDLLPESMLFARQASEEQLLAALMPGRYMSESANEEMEEDLKPMMKRIRSTEDAFEGQQVPLTTPAHSQDSLASMLAPERVYHTSVDDLGKHLPKPRRRSSLAQETSAAGPKTNGQPDTIASLQETPSMLSLVGALIEMRTAPSSKRQSVAILSSEVLLEGQDDEESLDEEDYDNEFVMISDDERQMGVEDLAVLDDNGNDSASTRKYSAGSLTYHMYDSSRATSPHTNDGRKPVTPVLPQANQCVGVIRVVDDRVVVPGDEAADQVDTTTHTYDDLYAVFESNQRANSTPDLLAGPSLDNAMYDSSGKTSPISPTPSKIPRQMHSPLTQAASVDASTPPIVNGKSASNPSSFPRPQPRQLSKTLSLDQGKDLNRSRPGSGNKPELPPKPAGLRNGSFKRDGSLRRSQTKRTSAKSQDAELQPLTESKSAPASSTADKAVDLPPTPAPLAVLHTVSSPAPNVRPLSRDLADMKIQTADSSDSLTSTQSEDTNAFSMAHRYLNSTTPTNQTNPVLKEAVHKLATPVQLADTRADSMSEVGDAFLLSNRRIAQALGHAAEQNRPGSQCAAFNSSTTSSSESLLENVTPVRQTVSAPQQELQPHHLSVLAQPAPVTRSLSQISEPVDHDPMLSVQQLRSRFSKGHAELAELVKAAPKLVKAAPKPQPAKATPLTRHTAVSVRVPPPVAARPPSPRHGSKKPTDGERSSRLPLPVAKSPSRETLRALAQKPGLQRPAAQGLTLAMSSGPMPPPGPALGPHTRRTTTSGARGLVSVREAVQRFQKDAQVTASGVIPPPSPTSPRDGNVAQRVRNLARQFSDLTKGQSAPAPRSPDPSRSGSTAVRQPYPKPMSVSAPASPAEPAARRFRVQAPSVVNPGVTDVRSRYQSIVQAKSGGGRRTEV